MIINYLCMSGLQYNIPKTSFYGIPIKKSALIF